MIAQVTATSGTDFIIIDSEHAPLTVDIVTQMIHSFMSVPTESAKHALIRIPSHDVAWIKWALDSGCSGIVIPMVNSAAEMEAILDRALYPPRGRRSFGPIYAPFAGNGSISKSYAGPGGYFQRARSGGIGIIPMIESRSGLENCDEILALDGVDGVFIGPADLRLAIGLTPAIDGEEPEFLAALQKITQAAKKYGKVVGCMGIGEETALRRAGEGMDFLVSTFDYGAILAGYAADLAKARSGVSKASQQSAPKSEL
jgi:2-keto-3-deoxy-L-rhamnonate aldolase RhmA